MVVNDEEIDSMSVITGQEEYPDDVLDIIKSHSKATVLNATELARGLGNEKAANIILLGTIIKSMGLEHIDWESILRANIKPQFVDLNLKAIKVGMEAM